MNSQKNSELAAQRMYPDPIYTLAYSIFRHEFNQAQFMNPEGQNFTNLFDGVLKYAFDPGVLRTVVYVNQEGITQTAEPAAILNRNGLIHLLENSEKVDNFDLYQIDLAQFRQADLAGGGDFLMNQVVAAINRIIAASNQGQTQINNMNLVARYAGDEFVFAFPKKPSNDQLMGQVRAAIEELQGDYLQPNGEISPQPVKLKENESGQKIEKFEIRPDEVSQKIYKTYLSRGVLLEQSEINKIKNRFRERSSQDLDQFLAEYAYDSDKVYGRPNLAEAEKIKFLIHRCPEFIAAFNLTRTLDEQNPIVSDQLTRTQSLIRFIEGAVFDRLLGDVFSSLAAIKEGLLEEQYSALYCFELKLLKEVNSQLSYGDGDAIINDLWNTISEVIKEDRQNFEIARRGGTFVLALKKGAKLSPDQMERFGKMSQIQVTFLSTETVTVPVGFAQHQIDTTPLERRNIKDWLDEQFSVINEASDDWLLGLLNYQQTANQPLGEVLNEILADTNRGLFADLIRGYFNGARFKERIDRLLKVMSERSISDSRLQDQLLALKNKLLAQVV